MPLTRGNPYRAATILVVVLVFVLAAAVGVNLSQGLPFNLNLGWPPRHDYVLSAAFRDANGVNPGANVLISGVQVGQVTGVSIRHDEALVTMRISQQYGPLHQGTVAAIRYSTLLAQKYVELTPAAGTAPLASGAVIPSEQTVTPVDFDQFLSSLDAKTRQQLQALVQQLGGGVAGQQAAINALLDHLAGLSELSPPTLDMLRSRDPQLAAILDNLQTVSGQLAQSHQQLGQFVASTAIVTNTLAHSDVHLDGLLTHLASVSRDTSQTLKGNEANLRTTIERLDPFLTQLTPQLSTAGGYFRQAAPTLKAEVVYLIPEVVSAIEQRDAGGNYLRQFVVVNTCYDTISSKPANPKRGCLAQVAGPSILGGGQSGGLTLGQHKRHPVRCPRGPLPTPSPSISLPLPVPSVTPTLPLPSPSASPCRKHHRRKGAGPSPSPSPSSLLGGLLGLLGGGS